MERCLDGVLFVYTWVSQVRIVNRKKEKLDTESFLVDHHFDHYKKDVELTV
ncbi:MAG: hypothetical protein BMS9Abin02_1752 [Anaerolineae bacterium]|nr:MAG: hypothetical protein BMS9Abin02_1752 [Anaerolineae bacterium]